MLRLVSCLLILLVAGAAIAGTTGDPLDTNDRSLGTVEADCGMALLNPQCGWCVTNCLYAIIAEAWSGSGAGDWDWGIR